MSIFAKFRASSQSSMDLPDPNPSLAAPLLSEGSPSSGPEPRTPPLGPVHDLSGVSSFRITDNSSYSLQSAIGSTGSRTSSTNSPQDSSENLEGRKSMLELQLIAAEMKCIETMCREISISHKRRLFLAMLQSADDVLKGSTNSSTGSDNYEDDGDEDGGSTPQARGRAKSSPEAEMERKRSLDVLNNDIPKVLESMRENVVDQELLIQELRYKLNIGEDEGVWGRRTFTSHSSSESPPGSARPSSMGRRSTWHGSSDGNSISTRGRSISRSGSEVDGDLEEKDAQGVTRRLSNVGVDMLALTDRMRAFTTT
jgi:hypothetical protein